MITELLVLGGVIVPPQLPGPGKVARKPASEKNKDRLMGLAGTVCLCDNAILSILGLQVVVCVFVHDGGCVLYIG